MEEIAEGVGRGVLNIIKWIVIDLFIEIFINGLGYITIKTFTLGKYPKPDQNNEMVCVIVGLISFVVIIGAIMMVNSN